MNFSPKLFRRAVFRLPYGLIGATLSLAPAAAAEASNYADVLSALQSGKAPTVLSDLGHCTNPETGKAGPAVQGGLRIQAFLVLPERGLWLPSTSLVNGKSADAGLAACGGGAVRLVGAQLARPI